MDGRTIRTVSIAAALLAAVLLLWACSPERHYQTLSFFFDGVPRPGEAKPVQKVSSQYMRDTQPGAISKVKGFFHKPYLENRCTSCHTKDQSQFLAEQVQKTLCSSCHEHDAFQARVAAMKFQHGPVASRSCLACHDPHESLQAHLLVEPMPKLCFTCHEQDQVREDPAHRDIGDRACLDCHDPHGGAARYFLKGDGKG
jgi:predicted CXXCH cytochrome family protein